MPRRRQILASNEIYHVVNRGVASSVIFTNERDYKRFFDLVNFYRFIDAKLSFSAYMDLTFEDRSNYLTKLKEDSEQTILIYAYCLMPNHFHFLIKQMVEDGVKATFTRVQNAYAKYFNLKNQRSGPLFQSRFKAKWIEKDEIFLHVSRYIHLNPSTSYVVEQPDLATYKWSSFPEYLGLKKPEFTDIQEVLRLAGGIENYKKFVLDQADYQKKLDAIKHLVMD